MYDRHDFTAEPATSHGNRVGLELRIETPENVVLTYQLAGPAIRSAAYLIDFVFRLIAFVVVAMVLGMSIGWVLPGMTSGLLLLLLFFMEWGYFVVCEGFFKGKSIGKHALGLRVIHERGHPLSFWGAMLRNLLRAADAIPFYGPALVCMILTSRFQRLGDLAAGTVVVSERRVVLPQEPIILEKIEPLQRQEIGSFVPEARTLSLIEEFLGRRHVLSHARGHAMAAPLARALAERLNFRGDRELPNRYPMAFLARVYVTFLQGLEEEDAEEAFDRGRVRVARQPVASGTAKR